MEFLLLGPIEAWTAGQRIDLGHARQQSVLAALLLDVGRVVPTDELIDRVWGEDPPGAARNGLSAYMTKLKAVLAGAEVEDVTLTRHSGGYILRADEDRIDACRFRHQIAEAAIAGSDERAEELLRGALSLWHGPALAGLSSPWLSTMRTNLALRKATAILDLHDIALRRGEHAALLGPLSAQAAANPIDERAVGQLMLALYRSGQQAEALRYYDQTRERLADEYGADPGLPLRDLHLRILRNDSALTWHASLGTVPVPGRSLQPGSQPGRPLMPRQLPAPVAHFAARAAELRILDELLDELATDGGTMIIAVVTGMAGVGKTALAVHWGHRVASRFPDGQLYINLRGFDPSGRTVTAQEAIRRFLEALGIPAEGIPPDPEAQRDRYLSLMAGQRTLVILDNARDTEQIRPLLPGGPGPLVLITSRRQMPGLVAAEGARHVALDVLAEDDARELLARRLGPARFTAEPEAADQLIRLCGHLPLALGIVAARSATRPAFSLAALAAELASAENRLDRLDVGDTASSVRAVFSWSASLLSERAARLFGLLGMYPGAEISVQGAASLIGLPLARTGDLLTELADANLLTENLPGRFALHDLLRVYAADWRARTSLRPIAGRRCVAFLTTTFSQLSPPTGCSSPRVRPSPSSLLRKASRLASDCSARTRQWPGVTLSIRR